MGAPMCSLTVRTRARALGFDFCSASIDLAHDTCIRTCTILAARGHATFEAQGTDLSPMPLRVWRHSHNWRCCQHCLPLATGLLPLLAVATSNSGSGQAATTNSV